MDGERGEVRREKNEEWREREGRVDEGGGDGQKNEEWGGGGVTVRGGEWRKGRRGEQGAWRRTYGRNYICGHSYNSFENRMINPLQAES